jgi:hypothetical protein
VGVGGARRGHDLLVAGLGAGEAQILLDRAVEQERVLLDDREGAAQALRRQAAHIVPADPHDALGGVVEPLQQPHDRRLARAAHADDADPFARADGEAQAPVDRPVAPGIGEGHGLEGDRRLDRRKRRGAGHRRRDRGPRLQQFQHRDGGRLAQHAPVQHAAQVALRAEHLDAGQQQHEQRFQRHFAARDPHGADRERGRRADRDAAVRQAARRGRDHVERDRAARELGRAGRELGRLGAALAERLQSRQTLQRVQQVGAEPPLVLMAHHAAVALGAVQRDRRQQGDQRGREQDERHDRVERDREDEDHERCQQRDQELRHVLAEEGMELLDPVDHRLDRGAGAGTGEMLRSERHRLVVEPQAQARLHLGRGRMREHRAGIFQHRAGTHGGER